MVSISNPQSFQAANLPNVEQILGAAVFDQQGLPRQFFVTRHHRDAEWMQLTLQFLGLQRLIIDEMDLPALDHMMLRTKAGNLVILPYAQGFIALLIKRALPQEQPTIDPSWHAWACEFMDKVVQQDERFKAI